MEQVSLVAANEDFETNFKPGPSGTLQIKNKAQVNRHKITAERISSTSFKAVLSRVQYGIYEKNRAVLVVFEFSFGYQKNSHHRINYASINIEFTKTCDASFTPPSPYEPNDDPVVTKILPVQIFRKKTETGWELEPKLEHTEATGDNLLFEADTYGDDDHKMDNNIEFRLLEIKSLKTGILNRITAAAVVLLPQGESPMIKAKLVVKPSVVFSVNPLRLLPRKDDPIFLDGITEKGDPSAFGSDFSQSKYPWMSIIVTRGEENIISKSATSSSATKSCCFRIKKIAHGLIPETVQDIISPSNPNIVRIKSWAPEADSEDSQSWLIATVIINDQEPNFFGLIGEKSLRLPRNSNDSESLIVDTNFLGMTTLASPTVAEVTVDIIAVTGLAGHAFGSWKERNGEFMWLRDALPSALPTARIITYGYGSKLQGSTSDASFRSYAVSLLAQVASARKRPKEKNRPLIFIAHSLGGILVKEALVASSRVDPSKSSEGHVYQSVCGILFIGVPHRGLEIEHLLPMIKGQPNEDLIRYLKPESAYLDILHDNFSSSFRSRPSAIHTYYETELSKTATRVDGVWKLEGPMKNLVPKSSATCSHFGELPSEQFPITASHSDMVKFEEGSSDYKLIRNHLVNMCDKHGISAVGNTSSAFP